MKVRVDYDLCESNALCEAIAPETFQLDDDENLQLLDDRVTDENRARIEQAVASCPKSAISIVEDDE
ncbi:MAG TPA: ferredoxin [Marmoricola sp.]|nr:ferredoxin [Marmoricola sp.]